MSISKKSVKAALSAFLSIVLAISLMPAFTQAAFAVNGNNDTNPKVEPYKTILDNVYVGQTLGFIAQTPFQTASGQNVKLQSVGVDVYSNNGQNPSISGLTPDFQDNDPTTGLFYFNVLDEFVQKGGSFQLGFKLTYQNKNEYYVKLSTVSTVYKCTAYFGAYGGYGQGTQAAIDGYWGGKITLPECTDIQPFDENLQFLGWYSEDAVSANLGPKENESKKLFFPGEEVRLVPGELGQNRSEDYDKAYFYAVFVNRFSYKVTFDPNGGSQGVTPMDPVTVGIQEQYFIPECNFIGPNNAKFIGWTINDGKVIYEPGEVIPANTVNKDLVFHAQWEGQIEDVPLYRLYNPFSYEHLYTTDAAEVSNLVSLGWKAEGQLCVTPGLSEKKAFRLYNPFTGEHLYTLDTFEKDNCVAQGWKYEGVSFYSADESGVQINRLFNPFETTNTHLYSSDPVEIAACVANGWRDEGASFYGLSAK